MIRIGSACGAVISKCRSHFELVIMTVHSVAPPHLLKAIFTSKVVALLLGAWGVVGLFAMFGSAWLGALTPLVAGGVFLLLFITILAASFGVVHEADHLAHELGEPNGTLILTLSIVLIEVIMIASVLLGPGENPTIGRDSIFAVMMIIMNLVMGVCIVAGAFRNGDQEFNASLATSYLSMIALLTGIGLVVPRFTSTPNQFTTLQAVGISAITAALYAAFLWLQMRGRRDMFLQPPHGAMQIIPEPQASLRAEDAAPMPAERGGTTGLWIRSALLVAIVLPIVLLAHHLATVTNYGIDALGAPIAVGGVIIAIIVFTPESITAVKAALNNEMQRAINLCLGAFVSTVGLTVPAVLIIGLMTDKLVIMGISGVETALFAITMLVSMASFSGHRSSPVHGLVHIALFAAFSLLLFYP